MVRDGTQRRPRPGDGRRPASNGERALVLQCVTSDWPRHQRRRRNVRDLSPFGARRRGRRVGRVSGRLRAGDERRRRWNRRPSRTQTPSRWTRPCWTRGGTPGHPYAPADSAFGGAPAETGYHTGDAKLAVATGRYELATTLPSTHPATSTATLPDGTFQLPIITAAQAYERLRGTGDPPTPQVKVRPRYRSPVSSLVLASFHHRPRGARSAGLAVPRPDSFEPLAWPAPHPDAFWRLGELQFVGDVSDGQLAADVVTLTVTMPARTPAPAQATRYTATTRWSSRRAPLSRSGCAARSSRLRRDRVGTTADTT